MPSLKLGRGWGVELFITFSVLDQQRPVTLDREADDRGGDRPPFVESPDGELALGLDDPGPALVAVELGAGPPLVYRRSPIAA
ncbi:MAG: hypothetical protein ACR2NR_14265 [Solirubrobacteraceae bacterium]